MPTTTEQIGELEPFAAEVFCGESAARLRLQVERLAPHFRMALITGERGTGLETVARRMQALSPMAAGPFVGLSAADFARGVETNCEGGVLFLYGLDTVEAALQTALLRRIGVAASVSRVIGSTHCDLRGMVAAGRMRPEVYARVGTLELRVPALREREVGDLAVAMLERMGHGASLTSEALNQMRSYGWPGNLAELWEVCGRLRGVVEELPLAAANDPVSVTRLDVVIERHVVEVLQRCAGNKLKAAELLGISRSTLYRMLETAAGPG